MVTEIAHLKIHPEQAGAFEAAVRQAQPLFQQSKGCQSMKLERVVEHAGDYHLVVRWQTLEDHTVGFRQSEQFAQWRALVSPYFREPPLVVHCEMALNLF